MTGTIAPQRVFRQVDPLIAHPPRPSTAERFSLPPTGFRPDIEGRAGDRRRARRAVPRRSRALRRRVHRRRRVLRRVRVPDHVPPARGGVAHRHRVAAQLLGPPGPAPAAGVVLGDRRDAARRPVPLRPAAARQPRPRSGGGVRVRHQPALRRSGGGRRRRVLRRRTGQVPAAALLVTGRGGAVLPRVARRDLVAGQDGAPVPPRPDDGDGGGVGGQRRGLRLVDRQQRAVGVLLTAGPGVGAADRRAAGHLVHVPAADPTRRRGADGRRRAGDHRRRRRQLRRIDDLPRRGRRGAGPRHRARHRRRLRDRCPCRPAVRARLRPAAVDRAALLRHLPVALAGPGPRRRRVGPAVGRSAAGGGRRVGGAGGAVVPARRGPGPPLLVAGPPAPPQPARRGVDPRHPRATGDAVPRRRLVRRRAGRRRPA